MTEPIVRFAWERALRDAQVGDCAALAVGFAMATYASASGDRIFPGRKRLSAQLGVSESTIKRGQKSLEARGFISKVGAPDRFRGHAQEYQLTIPEPVSAVSGVDASPAHGSPATTGQGAPATPQQTITNNSSTYRTGMPAAPALNTAPGFGEEGECGGGVIQYRSESLTSDLTARQIWARQAIAERENREQGFDRDGQPREQRRPIRRGSRSDS